MDMQDRISRFQVDRRCEISIGLVQDVHLQVAPALANKGKYHGRVHLEGVVKMVEGSIQISIIQPYFGKLVVGL